MRPWLTSTPLAVLAVVVAVASATARADDRIRTKAGIGVTGKITGIDAEGLVLEVNRAKRTITFAEIGAVDAEAFPDLKRAEQAYLDGVEGKAASLEEAEKLYQGIVKRTSPPWLRVLVSWRMFGVYARSGRIQEALDSFLEMAGTSPALVADLKLPNPVEGDHKANKAMLAKVDAALAKAAGKPYAETLKAFRLGLLLFEGDPAEVLALLAPLLKSEDPEIRRGAMLRRIELLLAIDKVDEAAAALPEVEEAVGADAPGELAYWQGRVLEKQGKPVEAALKFMRLPILYPAKDRPRTADALWRAGQALEAAKAPAAEAAAVYKEAVDQYAGTPGAEKAVRALARLGNK